MLLFETFKSQKELEKITNLIIEKISEKTYEYHKKFIENKRIREGVLVDVIFKNGEYRDGTYLFSDQKGDKILLSGIGEFKKNDLEIKFSDKNENIFQYIPGIIITPDQLGYKGELSEFLDKKILTINIKVKDNEDGTRGSFYPGLNEIDIFISEDVLKDLSYKKRESNKFTPTDIYMSIYNKIYSTLLHELQHAYDNYRSNGKALSYEDNEKMRHLQDKSIEKLSDEEKELLNRYSKRYLNSQHEINARFTQAIKDIFFIELIDFNEDGSLEQKMYPLHKVIKEFKSKFYGYRFLPEKAKKKLIRKVSQFWHYEKDVLEK